jgi:molybdate transport system permease protein
MIAHDKNTSGAQRRPPVFVVTLAIVGSLLFVLPLVGLLWRVPWSQFGPELRRSSTRTALRLSLECSLSALVLSLMFGTPLAWVLARVDFRAKRVVRSLLTLPMVLPPVVGGVALLAAFGRKGLVGQQLYQWLGIRLAFTTPGVVLAETFVALPFFVVTVEAALRTSDRELEDAAATLGATRWTVFRTITLPMIRPSLMAGAALCWARALGEFGATITFAANVEGVTQTIPLKVYLALESNPDGALVLSVLLLAVSFAVLLSLRDRWTGLTR